MLEQAKRFLMAQSMRTKALLSVAVLCVIGIVLVVLWWTQGTNNPEQVFWGAVANNLSTSGVTVETPQTTGGQTLVQIGFGQHPAIRSLTTLTDGASTVRTENLDTATGTYTEYASIESNTKNKSGKRVNFSSIIGVWALTGKTSPAEGDTPQTFGQALLGLALPGSLPFGDLTQSQRSQLMQDMQIAQVYDVAFPAAKKEMLNGRMVYVYKVSAQPLLYVQFLKNYAAAMGLHQLDQVNPNSYGGQPALSTTWTIDAHSEQIVRVTYNGQSESYSAYGMPVTTTVPKAPLSGTALQQRLTNLLDQ
jgi:hypothetical protein